MEIKLNGDKIKVDEETRIRDLINLDRFNENGVIGVVESRKTFSEEKKDLLRFKTEKGSFTIKLNGTEFSEIFKKNLDKITGKNIRWSSNKILALGPFSTDVEINKESYMYERGELFLGTSGMNNDNTYLMICRKNHEKNYGTAGGVIGKIQRGKHLIDQLKEGVVIENIETLSEEKEKINAYSTSDLELKLKPGMEIYTHLNILLYEETPVSSEHILRGFEDSVFRVKEKNSTFVRTEEEASEIPSEFNEQRKEGYITVRNQGDGIGDIYFYRKKRPPSKGHNVTGEMEKGKELIELAEEGDLINVDTKPKRLLSVGMKQKEAADFFEENGVKHIRSGHEDDEGLVVDQEPYLTMEVLEEGEVKTHGIDKDKAIKVKLFYEKAPESVDYFKRITGLKDKKIGELNVYFTSKEISNVLFKGNKDLAGDLLPENTPNNVVESGMIGITNRSKPNKGVIGIRGTESKEYGPTGEDFNATNIVGEVKEGLNRLDGLTDEDKLYIMEV
ncbi:MAG: Peptidyl-prolyl cis-trans isomerase (rotamase) cyclophilin family [Candidatus Methanohalarchaeum thermophilum]|uniref:UPF0288 protein BTN85_0877 n=1 Tax=Methanohalarchaeum thermophilum TaxID=1903181 RepID=A0A1Q6DVL1_METT1|nr:MAG: Peptidyl-prolyl cis-trans isomerase (rotamase) cyclophilin family [Candidatus Methanohalarchaeum thermophilum]